MDMHPENAWVAARLAALTPTWNPNPARARAAIDQATAPERRAPAYRLAAAAAGALLAAVLLAPSGRALAQELWYRLFVSRLQVVRLDLSRVPLDTRISTNGAGQSAASVAEATTIAGYTVELPPAAVLAGEPVLTVLQPVDIRQTIRKDTLSAALAAAAPTTSTCQPSGTASPCAGRSAAPLSRGIRPRGEPSTSRRRHHPPDAADPPRPAARVPRSIGSPKRSFGRAGCHGGRRERWAGSTRRIRRGCWTCRRTGRSRSRRWPWRAGRQSWSKRPRMVAAPRRPCSSAARGASMR